MYDEQTARTYERGTFGQATGFGRRPAVLVVDFNYGMTDPESPLGADMTAAVEATRRLLDAARERGLPVAYTTVIYSPGCTDGGAFVEKVPALRLYEGGGHWAELDARLAARPEEPIVVKKFASAFFGTNLASLLTSQAVDTVIVCGSTTSGCVRASALDALQNGFRVVVARDCVADRAQGPHEANLFDLAAKYADVVSLDEALAGLLLADAHR